jgi:hypothetical protein
MDQMDFSSREKFSEFVSEVIRRRFPLARVARGEQSFSIRVNGQTASLENLFRIAKLQPEDAEKHILRWAVELLRFEETSPASLGNLAEVKDRIMPVVLGSPTLALQPGALVTQELLPGLHVAYAIDHDRVISYIPRQVFANWKIELDELHDTAIANLVARSQELPAHTANDESGSVFLVLLQTNDGYDAARILLPNLHDRLSEFLGSPFIAGVPNRDILVCFRDSVEINRRIEQRIEQDYNSWPHQITRQTFLVTADGLAPHDPTPPDPNSTDPNPTEPGPQEPNTPNT